MKFNELRDTAGLTLIPLHTEEKIPTIKGWQELRGNTKVDLDAWEQRGFDIGIACGEASGGLEVLDVDSKYQLVGDNILKRWSEQVQKVSKTLLDKLVVTRTVSGGYHVLYRCTEVPIDGNKKLAMRPTTKDEQGKAVCLLETRGQGGQIKAYEAIKGSYEDIPTITAEERDILLVSARLCNEVIVPVRKQRERVERLGLSPMDHYDQENDASVTLELLIKHGWKVHEDKGGHWELTRPGKDTGISATLDFYPNMFYAWSSEGQFEDERGYTYAGVYAQLEHDGDFSAAAKALVKEGYGEDLDKEERNKLVNEMLGLDENVLTEEEEALVMGRIHSARDSMEHQLAYLKTKRDFRLSPKFNELHAIMKDIQPSHYVAWAASSSVGKTTTVRQIINDYLNETGQIGLFASLEMPSRDLALRNAMEMVDPHEGNYVDKDIVSHNLVTDEKFREEVINEWDNFFTIDSSYDIDVIFNMAGVFIKQMRAKGQEVGVVVIDFLQLANGGHNIDKQPELAQKMKKWAKKLDVIAVALLQMNSTMDKYMEPNENNISGHKALFQTADHGFILWKNIAVKNRIIIKSAKERWTLESRCDLVQVGMKIHSEPHEEVDASVIGQMAGNRMLN